MRMLELFSGSGVMAKAFRAEDFSTCTIDINPEYRPDYCLDLRTNITDLFQIIGRFDVVWASPPCQCFSVAAIGSNWKGNYEPKTDKTKIAIEIVKKTIEIIDRMKPRFWFIENPRGVLRKMPFMAELPRKTITYCQYGERRMKPTDIWTNADIPFRSMCHNGDSCHERASRGAKTGTQGLKGAYERGKLPKELCEFVAKWCKDELIK